MNSSPVSPSPRSLLDALKAPQASELARKRKIDSNPPVGKKRSRGQGSSEPKSVSAKDRVNEFPDECLTVDRSGKLFCSACREELSLRKYIITNHFACKKHKTSKEKAKTSVYVVHAFCESFMYFVSRYVYCFHWTIF